MFVSFLSARITPIMFEATYLLTSSKKILLFSHQGMLSGEAGAIEFVEVVLDVCDRGVIVAAPLCVRPVRLSVRSIHLIVLINYYFR